MLPISLNPRPKSDSNILGNKRSEIKAVQDFSEENRFRTYNVNDLKMVKAYLPQDVIREFKEGFEASSKKSPSASKSRNFVRKLVATLENKKDQGSGHCTADDEFLTECFFRPPLICQNLEKKTDFIEEQFAISTESSKQFIGDDEKKQKKLDDFNNEGAEQNLNIDEFLKICSSKNFYDAGKKDFFKKKIGSQGSKSLENIQEEDDDCEVFNFGKNFHQPIDEIDSYFRSNKTTNLPNIHEEPKRKRNSRRSGSLEEKRSFKNVLSSIIGFKSRKSALPKGKRNGFNPKDSLGEEMRLFRRDMMPVLLRASRPFKNNTEDALIDETFSTIIAASKPRTIDRSASIHPFYGGKKSAPQFFQALKKENFEPQNRHLEGENDFQRQEMKSLVHHEKNPPLYKKPPEIIYDIPKSKKIINPASDFQNDTNLSNYENTAIFFENNGNRIANPIQRKNIVCGKRALYIKNRKYETEF